ncbi:hypothetical protein NUW58_g1985 [Xylaria curta]|uniref:Uncharacterized protein n=1 Tax=Xylaria curta TaxID=42375 RepID=A0ACC1PHR8_9PEZI|nr:hypothetical protein NUW58_g1985 [Xylaria curta]
MASDDWERYKATILSLYLLENTPLHQVVSYMKTNHNFVRSKSQYYTQLTKKWGIKKNVDKRAWQYAAYHVNKRKGKKSEITFFGIPVPEERARREIQRYTGIPTANEFGVRLPSPEMPGEMIIRVKTPPAMESDISWPSTLAWFLFKNRVLPALRNTSGLLKAFFDMPIQREEPATVADTRSPLCGARRSPLGFRQAIRDLSDAIPNDLIDRQQWLALARNKSDPCLVTEMLKVIFLGLSNNLKVFGGTRRFRDQFLISLVRAVSHSNPEMLSVLFSGNCAATKAIQDVVYGSAIRENNYEFVARLPVPRNEPVPISCVFKISIDYVPRDGLSALEAAALRRYYNMATFYCYETEPVNQSARIWSVTEVSKVVAQYEYPVIMGLLNERGADVNEPPNYLHGRTALETAAGNGRHDAVRVLLKGGANIDGSMLLHCTRAVNLAMEFSRQAIAAHLEQYETWTEERQLLYDLFGSDKQIHLLYRGRHGYIGFDDSNSVESSDDGSQDCNEEVLHGHQEIGCAQMWQNDIGFMPTDPLDPSLVGGDLALCVLISSPWTLGSRDFTTEIGGTCENNNVVQQLALEGSLDHGSEQLAVSIGRNIASGSTADNHATDKMDYTMEHAMVVREPTPGFNMTDMEVSHGQSMIHDFVDMEWEALGSVGEFNSANNASLWDCPDQEMADLNMPLTEFSDEQIMPSSVVEPEWVGPLTGAEPDVPSDLDYDFFI